MTKPTFDGDTGQELLSSLAMRAKLEGNDLVQEALAFQQMKATPGWKILEQFINSVVAAYQDKLVEEENFKQIRRLQEHTKAYLNVLTYVDAVIAQGGQVRAEIQEVSETDPETDLPSESPEADNPT